MKGIFHGFTVSSQTHAILQCHAMDIILVSGTVPVCNEKTKRMIFTHS